MDGEPQAAKRITHSHSSKYKQGMSHKKYKQKEAALYRLRDIKL